MESYDDSFRQWAIPVECEDVLQEASSCSSLSFRSCSCTEGIQILSPCARIQPDELNKNVWELCNLGFQVLKPAAADSESGLLSVKSMSTAKR